MITKSLQALAFVPIQDVSNPYIHDQCVSGLDEETNEMFSKFHIKFYCITIAFQAILR